MGKKDKIRQHKKRAAECTDDMFKSELLALCMAPSISGYWAGRVIVEDEPLIRRDPTGLLTVVSRSDARCISFASAPKRNTKGVVTFSPDDQSVLQLRVCGAMPGGSLDLLSMTTPPRGFCPFGADSTVARVGDLFVPDESVLWPRGSIEEACLASRWARIRAMSFKGVGDTLTAASARMVVAESVARGFNASIPHIGDLRDLVRRCVQMQSSFWACFAAKFNFILNTMAEGLDDLYAAETGFYHVICTTTGSRRVEEMPGVGQPKAAAAVKHVIVLLRRMLDAVAASTPQITRPWMGVNVFRADLAFMDDELAAVDAELDDADKAIRRGLGSPAAARCRKRWLLVTASMRVAVDACRKAMRASRWVSTAERYGAIRRVGTLDMDSLIRFRDVDSRIRSFEILRQEVRGALVFGRSPSARASLAGFYRASPSVGRMRVASRLLVDTHTPIDVLYAPFDHRVFAAYMVNMDSLYVSPWKFFHPYHCYRAMAAHAISTAVAKGEPMVRPGLFLQSFENVMGPEHRDAIRAWFSMCELEERCYTGRLDVSRVTVWGKEVEKRVDAGGPALFSINADRVLDSEVGQKHGLDQVSFDDVFMRYLSYDNLSVHLTRSRVLNADFWFRENRLMQRRVNSPLLTLHAAARVQSWWRRALVGIRERRAQAARLVASAERRSARASAWFQSAARRLAMRDRLRRAGAVAVAGRMDRVTIQLKAAALARWRKAAEAERSARARVFSEAAGVCRARAEVRARAVEVQEPVVEPSPEPTLPPASEPKSAKVLGPDTVYASAVAAVSECLARLFSPENLETDVILRAKTGANGLVPFEALLTIGCVQASARKVENAYALMVDSARVADALLYKRYGGAQRLVVTSDSCGDWGIVDFLCRVQAEMAYRARVEQALLTDLVRLRTTPLHAFLCPGLAQQPVELKTPSPPPARAPAQCRPEPAACHGGSGHKSRRGGSGSRRGSPCRSGTGRSSAAA